MKNAEFRYVTQERAAALLGIPENELSRISTESGLGHKERAGNHEEVWVTDTHATVSRSPFSQ